MCIAQKTVFTEELDRILTAESCSFFFLPSLVTHVARRRGTDTRRKRTFSITDTSFSRCAKPFLRWAGPRISPRLALPSPFSPPRGGCRGGGGFFWTPPGSLGDRGRPAGPWQGERRNKQTNKPTNQQTTTTKMKRKAAEMRSFGSMKEHTDLLLDSCVKKLCFQITA